MFSTKMVDLINSVRMMNREMGYPDDGGTAIGVGKISGSFFIQGAYGGWQLQRVVGEGMESITAGYRSKRHLRELVDAMVQGMQFHRRSIQN